MFDQIKVELVHAIPQEKGELNKLVFEYGNETRVMIEIERRLSGWKPVIAMKIDGIMVSNSQPAIEKFQEKWAQIHQRLFEQHDVMRARDGKNAVSRLAEINEETAHG